VKRLGRHLFTLGAATSLLLFVGVVFLWGRTLRDMPGRWSAFVPGVDARYALELDRSRLTLMGAPPKPASAAPLPPPAGGLASWPPVIAGPGTPPALTPLDRPGTPASVVASIRNDQIVWDMIRVGGASRSAGRFDGTGTPMLLSPRAAQGTPVSALSPFDGTVWIRATFTSNAMVRYHPFTAAQLTPPLLRALEDPDRWLVAHVLLTRLDSGPRGGYEAEPLDLMQGPTFGGVSLRLVRVGSEAHWNFHSGAIDELWWVTPCAAKANGFQMAEVRERWHQRLDTPVCSATWFQASAATLALPFAWLGSRLTRVLRARWLRNRRRCRRCGYDLRASPDRCPECGTRAVKAVTT
jgi:hypothetical protein